MGLCVFGPKLLIGVVAVGFVPKKGFAAVDCIKGTFAYLISDSFTILALSRIAGGHSFFGLAGWTTTFAALQVAALV
ncbi:hexose phosphate transport protein UhpT [Vibrio ishigakensis]|uniref:Hexose phosphate transport protein UhpT n=1 Tax=Vibrio ishigakensis TaxID=1481914 RepID=A0A0B8Q9T0_9VIBR|nr:hexose phosphate transport protein UhpT [Vibrio ishigakensis]